MPQKSKNGKAKGKQIPARSKANTFKTKSSGGSASFKPKTFEPKGRKKFADSRSVMEDQPRRRPASPSRGRGAIKARQTLTFSQGKPQPLSVDNKPVDEKIAKRIAAASRWSRREAEVLVQEGRVTINGELQTSAAVRVRTEDKVTVDGHPLPSPPAPQMWLYYKPVGYLTTKKDPEGRQTIYDNLPRKMRGMISVGRLDINSEGLLLITNNGAMARYAELPITGWQRCYAVRVFGTIEDGMFDELRAGTTVEGVRYRPMRIEINRQTGRNSWLYIIIEEGKNREVRKAMEHVGLQVNRLVRNSYGPFELGKMKPGDIQQVPGPEVKKAFKAMLCE